MFERNYTNVTNTPSAGAAGSHDQAQGTNGGLINKDGKARPGAETVAYKLGALLRSAYNATFGGAETAQTEEKEASKAVRLNIVEGDVKSFTPQDNYACVTFGNNPAFNVNYLLGKKTSMPTFGGQSFIGLAQVNSTAGNVSIEFSKTCTVEQAAQIKTAYQQNIGTFYQAGLNQNYTGVYGSHVITEGNGFAKAAYVDSTNSTGTVTGGTVALKVGTTFDDPTFIAGVNACVQQEITPTRTTPPSTTPPAQEAICQPFEDPTFIIPAVGQPVSIPGFGGQKFTAWAQIQSAGGNLNTTWNPNITLGQQQQVQQFLGNMTGILTEAGLDKAYVMDIGIKSDFLGVQKAATLQGYEQEPNTPVTSATISLPDSTPVNDPNFIAQAKQCVQNDIGLQKAQSAKAEKPKDKPEADISAEQMAKSVFAARLRQERQGQVHTK